MDGQLKTCGSAQQYGTVKMPSLFLFKRTSARATTLQLRIVAPLPLQRTFCLICASALVTWSPSGDAEKNGCNAFPHIVLPHPPTPAPTDPFPKGSTSFVTVSTPSIPPPGRQRTCSRQGGAFHGNPIGTEAGVGREDLSRAHRRPCRGAQK